ncbi:hypothetical protein [Helicobacter sp. 11S02629-2]|uniref:hypothetical protein n=1 Tax=Helicobacter sp. 11S02629-2 TaxID=1476195 RepID=UPI000BA6C5E3|nr:hypothetical protein [Helicobacter sp. 11S02629-2]PAF44146.1 hypothetical protein BKH40_06000 [Helicobacter sp. 11S02629-2]
MLEASNNNYSLGLDTQVFVTSKYKLCKMLKKMALERLPKDKALRLEVLEEKNLFNMLKTVNDTTKQANHFINHKCRHLIPAKPCKKHPFQASILKIEQNNRFLSNTMIVLENTTKTYALARKNHKRLNTYVMVIFPGLHQPSKNINAKTLKLLRKLRDKIVTDSIDLALDFSLKSEVSSPEIRTKTKKVLEHLAKRNRDFNYYHQSIYLNKPRPISGLQRVLLYDKYQKQTNFHAEPIKEELKDWKRLELTFKVGMKWDKFVESGRLQECINLLENLAIELEACTPFGVDTSALDNQLKKLKDLRICTDIPAWAKVA